MALKVIEYETEEEKVAKWRQEQLVRAGVKAAWAEVLANSEADLHIILKAKAQGCPDKRLAEIFT